MSPALLEAIRAATGVNSAAPAGPVGGGCIHRAWHLGPLFVKTNRASCAAMFEAEADGLRAIAATGTLRVPEVVACGTADNAAFLALEWLELRPGGDEGLLGTRLAALHQTEADRFGWHRDNTIGATPQPNPPTADWFEFLREHRLGHMFRLLAARGEAIPHAATLLAALPRFFPEGPPRPALLHGDLWGGNAAYLKDGTPVVFDPACWHGDPEADLAMTRLFGGFGPRFYRAYSAARPQAPAHPRRHELHQLYHLLNHALLFGGHYLGQARQLTRSLASAALTT